MKKSLKKLAVGCLTAALLLALGGCSEAASNKTTADGSWKPTKPVNLIVGYAAGGRNGCTCPDARKVY